MAVGPIPLLSVFALGLTLGVKHAFDADHLAAVSTIAGERRSVLASMLAGTFWGLGHTFALLAAGAAVILLRVEISPRMANLAELCAAMMLIALGVDALRKVAQGGHLHLHAHRHGGRLHMHPHVHERPAAEHGDAHQGWHHGGSPHRRPFLVGIVHGLAGSAAVMLVILAGLPSPRLGFAYIVAFGAGSVGGMSCMSALVGLPAALTANRFHRAHLFVRAAAGIASLAIGIGMAYDVGAGHFLIA